MYWLGVLILCYTYSALAQVQCSVQGVATIETPFDQSLQQLPLWVKPLTGAAYTTAIARTRSKVYRTFDLGVSWEEVHFSSAEPVRSLVVYDSIVIVLGFSNKTWVSVDEARTFAYVETPGTFQKSLQFHPRHPGWILAVSTGNCNIAPGRTCSNNLYLSQDKGLSWKLLRKYVWVASWHGLVDFDNMIVIWERRAKTGNMYDSPSISDVTRSNDFFQADMKVVAPDTVGYLVLGDHIFYAQLYSSLLELYVSKNMGETFDRIFFPGGLPEVRYRILDVEAGSTKIAVIHSQRANWANVYGSVAANREFSLELEHVKCPQGVCDHERVRGIEGIYVANVYRRVSGDYGDEPYTVVSYDMGAEWAEFGHPRGITAIGKLQLQGRSDSHTELYSLPEAVGILFANGNVGGSVSPVSADLGVYFSRDAGWTWQYVAPSPHIYEMGNRGAIVVLAKNEEPTTSLQYSLDEGGSWASCTFGAEVMVQNIVSDPAAGSKSFILVGYKDSHSVAISLDFSGIHNRECHGWQNPQDEDSDYEFWVPSDRKDGDCMLGRRMSFVRRKQAIRCFNPIAFNKLDAFNGENCTCAYENYEW